MLFFFLLPGWAGKSILHIVTHASVAQLDRAPDYESVGRRFESCRARINNISMR